MSITEEMNAKGLESRALLWRAVLDVISKLEYDTPLDYAVAIAQIAIEEGQAMIARGNR